MDVESVYLIVGVVVFSAVILLVIDYLFKNKSYEEAIAEQRKQNSALYSDQRPKPKEKKQKKANKKVKEKKSPRDGGESVEESETQVSDSNTEAPKHHVEFSEPTVIQEDAVKEPSTKRKQKREAVRPILVNRDSSAENIQPDVDAAPANHFEELHPKDDFELLNAHLKEEKECVLKEKSKNKQNIEPQTDGQPPKAAAAKKAAKQPAAEAVKKAEEKRDVAVEPTAAAETAAPVASAPPTKDKKKKKSELNTIQQLGDKHGVNVSILMPMVRKAELSREEVQTLIDMLLNKQQDAPAMVDEWSEGKADPVQKLKKQLADKEKQVVELQEALSSNQTKMREVRAEQTSERAALQASVRDLQENLARLNAERQAFDSKYQALSMQFSQSQEEKKKMVEEFKGMQMHLAKTEECKVTIAQLNFKLQEQQEMLSHHASIQKQFQEDSEKKEFKIHEFMELNNALMKETEDAKKANNKLLMQLQSFEHNKNQELMTICMQKEESDRIISQMRADMSMLEEEREQLNNLVLTLKNEGAQVNDSVAALTGQIGSLKGSVGKVEEERAKLEKENGRLEGELGGLRVRVEQLEGENARLEGERVRLEGEKKRIEEESGRVEKEKVGVEEEVRKLRVEKRKLEEEKRKLEEEKRKLEEEKSKLEEEKKMLLVTTNGSIEDEKQHQKELIKLNSELTDVKQRFQQLESSHSVKLAEIRQQLQREIEEEKNKNNDLRRKNWTVVEALNQAESRNKTSKSNEVESLLTAVRKEEREANRKFVQRLFPDVVQLSDKMPYDQWQETVATAVRQYVDRKPEPEVVTVEAPPAADDAKLHAELANYKKIIDETESMLSLLQKHIESEEIRWRSELRTKEDLIEDLKADTKLQRQLAEVSEKLRQEEESKRKLAAECESNMKLAAEAAATSKKQTEEIQKLRLELEQRKHSETNNVQTTEVTSKGQNHSTNGPTPPVPTDSAGGK